MRLILFLGGAAALAWQILWSHHLGLALGASARGVALTVATAMAGMTLGSLLCARALRTPRSISPILLYGALELIIALFSLLPGAMDSTIMELDSTLHRQWPAAATPFTVLALVLSIGPACLAMGATVPVMGMLARSSGTPLSRLYACNTAGAATGVLVAAFFLLPQLGLAGAGITLILVHLGLALTCAGWARHRGLELANPESPGTEDSPSPSPRAAALVFLSGMAAFTLEVAWFRSLRSAWFSTADSLAVMLSSFLIALALGAAAAPWLRQRRIPLWGSFAAAGVLVILATPLLAHFDEVDAFQSKGAWRQIARFLGGLVVMGPAVALIGIALPTLLDEGRHPRDWARLYSFNTLGSVIGANAAAWILLEKIGPTASAWVAGILLATGAGFATSAGKTRTSLAAVFAFILALALWVDRGERDRIPGAARSIAGEMELIARRHSPDATLSVVGFEGGRALLINGFVTTAESADPRFHYMEAIGRIPMLLHPAPHDALVICFGTGRTAHAVRDEGPRRLDLADLNAAVFDLASHFTSNHEVLRDPRVEAHALDGRAWLRRTNRRYDVVTLEPMPPFFSGSNALYSTEFYELVSSRLRPGGYLAQWFPLHLMTPDQATSIAASFLEVFPDSILWMDPGSLNAEGLPDQGILIGRQGPATGSFWEVWPGFLRPSESGERTLTADQARGQVTLDPAGLQRFAAGATPVTDDNQLLEYGASPYRSRLRVAESIRQIHQRIAAAK